MTIPAWLVSRVAAASLLAVLVLIPAWLLLGPAVVAWQQERDAAATSQALLDGYRRAAASRPALEARLATLQTAERQLPGLIRAASAPEAAATLQTELRRLIEAEGGEVRTTQPGNSTKEAGLEKIEVAFDLMLPEAGLPHLLSTIESHEPYLFADQLSISPGGGKPARLSVRLRLHAYRRVA